MGARPSRAGRGPTPQEIRRRRASALALALALALLIAAITHPGARHPHAAAAAQAAQARSPTPASAASLTRQSTWLAPGSDPSVLPGPVLIADRDNNRLLEVSPRGRILWRFPGPRDLAPAQSFLTPDDAFYSPDGRRVIATQEDNSVISVIDLATRRIVYRYGHPGVPGSSPGYVHNPDDALLMPSGEILTADIVNCRLLVIAPPRHRPLRQLGVTGACEHDPGRTFGSPNGAFPMASGDTAVTEINGNWLQVIGRDGRPVLSIHPPGLSYPSDINEVRPGLFLAADYATPGTIETFTSAGRLTWRYAPGGGLALKNPSLAVALPNGDILANDDRNHRVIVIDPRVNRIVWQYGHTGRAGFRPGFLNNPDGVDLAPPDSLAARFAANLAPPRRAR